ncbi:MAG: VWA domain-containing protein [Bacteroidales bacterium]|nr:VWA domain-containing protein [Bacteroidales bacterium]MCM1148335.1 VWA domain-containing protein [Bacteroidales bacterium]MCM1206972.1 VWA domain-containing protein [Bacillota bacterium]
MRFEDSTYLTLLLVIPVLFALRLWMLWLRGKALRRWGDKDLTVRQMPDVSRHRPLIKFCLMMGALALVIVMIARLQIGTKVSNEKRNGIEAIICMDISNSMLCEDVKPSRLDRCKMLVENMVDNFVNDKIGLVVFAGDAFTQLPITADYVSAKMFLQSTTPALIEDQGTDIAKAIELAQNSFTKQKNIGRAVIVITDGEDHEGRAVEAAKAAKKAGIKVFILGVGSKNGAPIPNGEGGYMIDNSGNEVMTRLNEDMCREIASAGSGTYIHVDNTNDAQERLNSELSKMQKSEVSSVIYSEYDEQFQLVGLIAVLLLVLEVLVQEAKPSYQKAMNLFKKKHVAMIAVLFLLPVAVSAQNDRMLIRQGNRQFHSQQYEKAEATFRKAVAVNPNNPEALYNLGCALMVQQKDSMALGCFMKAGDLQSDRLRRAQTFHNIGVICQQNKQYGEAVEAYKESLRMNPKDNETRYNLALCMKQKKNEDKNPKNKNKDQNKQEQQKDQKNKQDKNKDRSQDKKLQNQGSQDKMSKENAEQLLNAAMQQEQATQQRLKKAQSQPRRARHQKNW